MRQLSHQHLIFVTFAVTSCMAFGSETPQNTPYAAPYLNLKLATIEAAATLGAEAQLGTLDDTADVNSPEAAAIEMDIWARIRRGYAIPDLENPLVANHLNWYVKRPEYIQRTTLRASRYLYHVLEELEKRGMPTELALLPFIESAFNPNALSTAKAAGMWQFIPSTGRDYNLTQNMFRDDRRGVIASTDAALSYLQKLYNMFGDWQLALAAYNWGEGSVQRAIKKNQAAGLPIDFNSLSRHMPAETRNYVPKLQAVKNIINSPEQYNLGLPKAENQPYFTTVSKTRDIDVKVAAQLAEMPLDEFKALNPQFNRPVITGGDQTKILMPQENADKFKTNLLQWGHALSSWTTHTITSAREKIETLASKFSTTPAVLREVNNIPAKANLRAGSTILVPKTEATLVADIAPEIADHATMIIEPEASKRLARAKSGRNIAGKQTFASNRKNVPAPTRIARVKTNRSSAIAAHRPRDGKAAVMQAKQSKTNRRQLG
jgi:membrane-bound lytic murein transglycosylase D